MRSVLAFALALASTLTAGVGAACPCSDDAAGSLGLTRPDERFAAALVLTTRSALGHFDAQGRYRALGDEEAEHSEELLLRLGMRAPSQLEWLLELGGAHYRLHADRFAERSVGLGDAIARARYLLRPESMPHERWPLPALGLSALVRAPLGTLAEGRSAGFGSGGAQLGLGAWEAGLGLDASRSVLPELAVSLAGELAYRFEDHVLERTRRLGPRAELALGLRAFPEASLSGSVVLRARASGDVTLDGRRLSQTGERLWTVAFGVAHFDRPSGVRSSLTLSVDPPWSGQLWGQSSTAAVALGCSLGYGF